MGFRVRHAEKISTARTLSATPAANATATAPCILERPAESAVWTTPSSVVATTVSMATEWYALPAKPATFQLQQVVLLVCWEALPTQ